MRDYATISKRLRQYSENCVAYKLDADFANAVTDAADAIEELLAKVPTWISVDDELPETGKVVLLRVNCKGAKPHTGFLTADGWFMHDVLEDMRRSKWKVTHWMPLPKAPEPTNGGNHDN